MNGPYDILFAVVSVYGLCECGLLANVARVLTATCVMVGATVRTPIIPFENLHVEPTRTRRPRLHVVG